MAGFASGSGSHATTPGLADGVCPGGVGAADWSRASPMPAATSPTAAAVASTGSQWRERQRIGARHPAAEASASAALAAAVSAASVVGAGGCAARHRGAYSRSITSMSLSFIVRPPGVPAGGLGHGAGSP